MLAAAAVFSVTEVIKLYMHYCFSGSLVVDIYIVIHTNVFQYCHIRYPAT